MQTQEQTSKQYFKALNIIFAALLMGQIFFAGIAYVVNTVAPVSEGTKDSELLSTMFLILVPLFMIGGIVAGRIITKERLNAAKEKQALYQKLEDYRALSIVRLALMEGPTFFAIITFMITGNLILLGLAGLFMIVFATHAPSKNKLVDELELSHSDRKLIEDPLAVVVYINRSNN